MRRAVRTAVVTVIAATVWLSPAAAPVHADGHRPGENTAATVDRLYGEAARAVRSYETVRRAVDRKRHELDVLRRAARRERGHLGELREQVGDMAAKQYRDGGLAAPARLFLSDTPDELLELTTLLREGDHATAALLDATARSERRLDTATSAADRVVDRLASDARRQAAIRRRIEAGLSRAREMLRRERERARGRQGQGQAGVGALSQDCPNARSRQFSHRPDLPALRAAGTASASTAWVSPVGHYRLSAGFARSGAHWSHRHTGQDFAVPVGTPVWAAGTGTVVAAGCGDGFGNQIVIRHACGYYTQYAHLSRLDVVPGDRVRTGDLIGLSGSTGNSTGPHLHFEVRVTPLLGSGVDPVPWMAEHGAPLRDTP